MATVTPVPFAVGLICALALFVVLVWLLLQESRRPVHWPERRHVAAPVEDPPRHHHLRIVHPGEELPPPTRRVSHARAVVVAATFLLWSVWSTARSNRLDPHH